MRGYCGHCGDLIEGRRFGALYCSERCQRRAQEHRRRRRRVEERKR